MAIYHCSIKVISRGKGKSAVAAAYRAGEKITNEFDGMTHDYTHKGGVVHTAILLPDHAPLNIRTGLFCGTKWRKSRKRKTPNLRGRLKLPCPAN